MQDIKYYRERVSTIKEDIKSLLTEHWKEIAVNQDKIKLNTDWEKYDTLDQNGSLGIYTARKGEELIGYFIVIADYHAHYKDHIYAVNDVIYLKPEFRKTGVGAGLIKFAEEDLKELGVSVLVINTKVHKPFDTLMEHLDFTCIERVYSKYIGE